VTELDDQPLVRVTLLLADAAQVADRKLFVMGGGIALIGPRPQPLAVAVLVEVPWDRANIKHAWQLELVDADGNPVMANDRPVLVGGEFEAGRPAGIEAGTPLPVPMAINFSGLPVKPGESYQLRFAVDGTTEPEWQTRFSVRPLPAATA
jgi:hypothetical protein